MRAGIHDEAAFLPDQAIHKSRVESDVTCFAHHDLAQRHRKALLKINGLFGSVAGVDAAVPHLALASQIGGSQEIAVVHAARGVQVGAVVPLAVAFGAQADLDGVQGALQSGVDQGCGFFLRVECDGPFRQGDGLAQFFERQLFVKTPHAGDAPQQTLGFLFLGVVLRRGAQGAGAPVNPSRVFLRLGAHGLGRGQDLTPLAHAQSGAHFPAQQVVVQVAVFLHLGKVAAGVVLQFLRGLFANHAPSPVAFFLAQLDGPAPIQQIGGFVGVFGGQPDQGQHRQLFAVLGDGDDAFVQVFGWVGIDQGHLFGQTRCFDVDRCLGRARAVGVHGQPRLAPKVQAIDLFARVQMLGHIGAAIVGFAQGVPQALGFFGHIGLAVHGLGGQGVAAHFAVIAHAVARVFGGEVGPVAALAQLQQPVGAQAVFVVAAGIASQEAANL